MKRLAQFALLMAAVYSVAGCGAMNSLIFHPLHVVHEQHKYNEQHKYTNAPAK